MPVRLAPSSQTSSSASNIVRDKERKVSKAPKVKLVSKAPKSDKMNKKYTSATKSLKSE